MKVLFALTGLLLACTASAQKPTAAATIMMLPKRRYDAAATRKGARLGLRRMNPNAARTNVPSG